jgi:hypothetical protein
MGVGPATPIGSSIKVMSRPRRSRTPKNKPTVPPVEQIRRAIRQAYDERQIEFHVELVELGRFDFARLLSLHLQMVELEVIDRGFAQEWL